MRSIQHDVRPVPCTSRRVASRAALVLAVLGAASCGGGDDEDFPSFSVRTSPFNAVASAPVAQDGRWAVYLASEADTGVAGTSLNEGDADTSDAVAVRIDLQAGTTTNLGVAARSAVVVGNRAFLVVSETEDGVNWSGGDPDELVLVTVAPGEDPAFVDVLSGGSLPDLVVAEARVFYRAAAVPNPGETELRYVDADADAPLVPITVLPATGETHVDVRPVVSAEGVLFCFVDEVADGVAHNGDGAADDTTVVALVDARADTPTVRNTGLAVADTGIPMTAAEVPGGDRAVAFLVSEAAQGASLNALASLPIGWLPTQCDGGASDDADTTDDVLHWLTFAEWDLDPLVSPPVNTGIAGVERVLLFDGHVATLSPEDAQGAGCDFNASGTEDDTVARWIATETGSTPEPSPALNLAVDVTTPGGASGLTALSGRLVAALEVASNEDHLPTAIGANLGTKTVVGWVAPDTGSQWIVALRVDEDTLVTTPVGVNWMAAEPQQTRLPIGVDESVGLTPTAPFTPISLNSECAPATEANDADTTDTLVGWLRFTSSPTALQLFGVGFALLPSSPGVVIAGSNVFFRVSEAHHDEGFNPDGDLADSVLVRRPLSSCAPSAISVLNSLVQPSILTDGTVGALLLLDEGQTIGPGNPDGLDINEDGQVDGFVMRFFRF